MSYNRHYLSMLPPKCFTPTMCNLHCCCGHQEIFQNCSLASPFFTKLSMVLHQLLLARTSAPTIAIETVQPTLQCHSSMYLHRPLQRHATSLSSSACMAKMNLIAVPFSESMHLHQSFPLVPASVDWPLFCRNFYKMDLGPKPGVSLRAAVLAEGTLTYLLNLVILYATSELHNCQA